MSFQKENEIATKTSKSIMGVYMPVLMAEAKKGKGYITFGHGIDYPTYRAFRDGFLKVELDNYKCSIAWEFDYDFKYIDKTTIREQLLQETMSHRV